MLETRKLAYGGSPNGANDAAKRATGSGRNPELRGHGHLALVATHKLAKTAFGFAVSVRRSDIEVTDARIPGGFKHVQGLAISEPSHNAGASEAKTSGRASGRSQRNRFQDNILMI